MSHAFAFRRTYRPTIWRQVGFALACTCLAVVATTRAQVSDSSGNDSPLRLLTPKEGRVIVNVAWQQELPTRGVRDCSHFVHEIYENAGFAYPYASSFEIYAGNENFARVKYPHAGDLIAWPGHVGIVVDPSQHSFYSLVRTGLQEQDYQSAYWRSRGRPRFFRFRVESSTTLTAANTTSSHRPPGTAPPSGFEKSVGRARVTSSVNQSIDVVPGDERVHVANPSADRPPVAGSGRRSTIYGPPASTDGSDTAVADRETDKENDYEVEAAAPFEPPKSIAISASSNVPTREEVAEAISELSDALGGVLRKDDAFNAQTPIVIVEEFNVEKVEIKRDRGWAHLTIDSKLSIGTATVQMKRRREKARWELRRTESGWEAMAPTDRTYVPHDVAVKNLAAQLARLAASDGAAQHEVGILQREAQIVSALGALLERR